eukprot:TRINITY_DN6735_c0_g1_i2.p1 TRINITY_DN6735_c0_g1~~TRINITY_DN6735_c0_g1_i2.p1  ORF type:complete len:120 (-),score=18.40 TRINITY_DN6735_c0_g1_i2:69-428(-)
MWEGGTSSKYTAEFLRVQSPSAEVRGHGPGTKKVISGKSQVSIVRIEPRGNYAISIMFDDLHDSGIYSWDYLYYLYQNEQKLMSEYLAELERDRLSRDPPVRKIKKPDGTNVTDKDVKE